jgi:hypothetical protein
MTPLCKVDVTLPGGFPGGVGGDGSADERWGAGAAGSAADLDQKRLTTETAAHGFAASRRHPQQLGGLDPQHGGELGDDLQPRIARPLI